MIAIAVDDEALMLGALVAAIEASPDITQVSKFSDCEEALDFVKNNRVDVAFESEKGRIDVCKNGAGVDFSEEKAKEILLCSEIRVLINVGDGDGHAVAWGCDLTYDYVKINGDYRT